jgi:hypothetical protein
MIPTRENSGLELVIDQKGRAKLFVSGNPVVGATSIDFSSDGTGGDVTVRIMSRFVTFRHSDDDRQ